MGSILCPRAKPVPQAETCRAEDRTARQRVTTINARARLRHEP